MGGVGSGMEGEGRAVVDTAMLQGLARIEEEPDVPWQIRGGSQRSQAAHQERGTIEALVWVRSTNNSFAPRVTSDWLGFMCKRLA